MMTLVCIAGLVACIVFRRQAPRPLMIAAAALAAWVLMAFIESALVSLVYGAFASRPQGGLVVSNALSVMGWVFGAGRAAALGGLIWAVLSDRNINFQTPGL